MKIPLTTVVAILLILSNFCLLSLAHASTATDSLKIADAELNVAYQTALKSMPTAENKAQLREAERAWVAFKEAELALYASLPGASSNAYHILELEMTDARTKQLKELMDR